MGVQGTGGASRSRNSHLAYYVALVCIVGLLVLLIMYFFYFFINKIRKFNSMEFASEPSSSCRPPPGPTTYPVQSVVREGASEMAKLCKQLPPPGKGGTVFPTSSSPAAIRTTGETPSATVSPTVPDVPPAAPAAPANIEPAAVKSAAPAIVPTVVVEAVPTQ